MAGVPQRIIDDPIHVENFRAKYTEAPQRDKGWSSRFVKWLVNETRNPAKPLGAMRDAALDPIAEFDRRLAEQQGASA